MVHKAYETLTPIQIAVYDDKLEIWNCGTLPEDWTLNNLLGKHRSRPYNPDIANVFFRAGEIEAWGRGIERIIAACKNAGYPELNLIMTVVVCGLSSILEKNMLRLPRKLPRNFPRCKKIYWLTWQ